MSFSPRWHALLTVLLFAFARADSALAQSVTISGRVTSTTGQPLGGASVGIPTLNLGTTTGVDGRYSLSVDQSRGRSLDLRARYIGYTPKNLKIELRGERIEQDFVLERDIFNLESVVVTGTSDATAQKMTPFSVAAIDNTQLKEVPAASPLGALAGKVAGASLVTASGQPGSVPTIRLRSATSLVGSSDPLVIVDGTISRLSLADINAEDIERIEIIKGAAASSLYGSDAANGVVQIFTKRNANLAEGQTAYTLRNEYGQNQLNRMLENNMHHHFQVLCGVALCTGAAASSDDVTAFFLDSTGTRVENEDFIAGATYPAYNDPFRAVYRQGRFASTYGSFGQRRENSNFSASFQNHEDAGIIALRRGYTRRNFRINADQKLGKSVEVGVGAFYARSRADQVETYEPGFQWVLGMVREIEPDLKLDSIAVDCPASVPNCAWKGGFTPAFPNRGTNPLYALQEQSITNDRDRFSGTFSARYRPLTWLTGDARIGYDQSNQQYEAFTPLGFVGQNFTTGLGRLVHRANEDRAYNTNITLTSSLNLHERVRNTSKAALVYEDQTHAFTTVEAARLAVPNVRGLGAVDPTALTVSSRRETVRANNTYFVTTFEIDDRYILDGLIRQDRSSLFGADERAQVYHRVSGAWRVSENFTLPLVDELKVRASVGTAGLRPPYVAQYEVLSIIGGSPAKISAGNPGLKPAFSRETEYGFNLNVLQRYSAEYSHSRKKTTDQILLVPISATTGYQGQWQNAATLEGDTHEFAAGVVLLSKADYFLRVNITGERTRQRVTDLNLQDFDLSGTRIQKGEVYGAVYGRKLIRTRGELEETISTGMLSGSITDYVLNEEGYYVRTSQFHTVGEVPLQWWRCGVAGPTCVPASAQNDARIGDVNPEFTMGFNTMTQWKSLSASATVTWVKGGDIFNFRRASAFFGGAFTDPVYDQSGKPDPGPCPALAVDPSCPYLTGRKPVTYYNAFLRSDAYFLEKGTHLKLRELAINWELPKQWAARFSSGSVRTARFGIVGRNLWTITKYSGYDPDVAHGGDGRAFLDRADVFSYPPYRTITAMLELGF